MTKLAFLVSSAQVPLQVEEDAEGQEKHEYRQVLTGALAAGNVVLGRLADT